MENLYKRISARLIHMNIDDALKVFAEPGRINAKIIESNGQSDLDFNAENLHAITMANSALILCKILRGMCEDKRLQDKDSLYLSEIERTIQFVVEDHPGCFICDSKKSFELENEVRLYFEKIN